MMRESEGRPALNGTASNRLGTGNELAPDSTVCGTVVDAYAPCGALACPAWCDGDRGDGFHAEWECREDWPCDCGEGEACVLVVTHARDLGHGVEVSASEYVRGDLHAWEGPVLYVARLEVDDPAFGSVDEAQRVLEVVASSGRAFGDARALMDRIRGETGAGTVRAGVSQHELDEAR